MEPMLAQSATLGGAVPDRSPLGWLILLPLGCLVLGQLLLVTTGIIPVLYRHSGRSRRLHAPEPGPGAPRRRPGSTSRYWRINSARRSRAALDPAVDALLLAGGLLLEPIFGFRQGLHVWARLFSPVCLALGVLALAWAIEPVLDRDARMFACLAYLMQPTVLAYSSVGRRDHHSLLLLLFVILLGLTFRLLTVLWTGARPGSRGRSRRSACGSASNC